MTLHKPQELHFNESRYLSFKKSIYNHANILIVAAAELHRLGLTNIESEDLKDGQFTEHLLSFHKKEHAKNASLKIVSFEKYLDLIELEYKNLQKLESKYLESIDTTFEFYPNNDPYFNYCRSRNPQALLKAKPKVYLKMSSLFTVKGNDITVNLPNKYFKLYSTNQNQLEKIDEIDTYFNAAKKIEAKHKNVKEVLGKWVTKLDYTLKSYELNYNEILNV